MKTKTMGAKRDGPERAERGIPVAAEVLGYVGGALALAAVIALVSAFGGVLGEWGRIGISAAMTIAALLGGLAIERVHAPAAERLSQFLLALSVLGGAITARFLVRHTLFSAGYAGESGQDWVWFSAAATAALMGGALWWKRRTWLQHIMFGLGVAAAAVLVLPLIPIDGPEWGAGAVLALLGVIWGALAYRGRLEPENAGLALGALGVIGGFEVIALMGGNGASTFGTPWALWVGLVASLGLTVGGVLMRRNVVLGVGAAGTVMFAAEAVSEAFTGVGVPVALIGIGIAVLAGAVYLVRREHGELTAIPVAAEIAGYVGFAFILAGGGLLLSGFWEEFGVTGRIVVPAIAALVTYGSGFYISRIDGAAAHRLSQVLLAAGTLATAFTAAMIVRPVALNTSVAPAYVGDIETWTAIVGAAVGTIAGGITWFLRKGSMTLIVFGGAMFMLSQVVWELGDRAAIAFWVPGLVMLAVGLAWVLLGLYERLTPSNTALALGSYMSLSGLLMLQNTGGGEPVAWAAVLGIGVSIAAIIASIPLKRGVLLGFGAVGLLVMSIQTIMSFFEGEVAAPVLMLIGGITFILLAVLVAVLLPKMRDPSRHNRGAMPA